MFDVNPAKKPPQALEKLPIGWSVGQFWPEYAAHLVEHSRWETDWGRIFVVPESISEPWYWRSRQFPTFKALAQYAARVLHDLPATVILGVGTFYPVEVPEIPLTPDEVFLPDDLQVTQIVKDINEKLLEQGRLVPVCIVPASVVRANSTSGTRALQLFRAAGWRVEPQGTPQSSEYFEFRRQGSGVPK